MGRKSNPLRPSGETWFTRSQVASLLGVAEADVEAMHGQDLHPWQEKDRRWRYSPEDVARAWRKISAAQDPTDEGKVAVRAFTMFREGKSMADVVIATERPATTVKRLFTEYLEMAGGLWLSPPTVEVFRGQLGAASVVSAEALASTVGRELARRYAQGREDGKADAEDFGEVVDFQTGERKRVLPPR